MITGTATTGILIPCWDSLRAEPSTFERFVALVRDFENVIVLSQNHTASASTILRERVQKSFLADSRILSVRRLARLCTQLYRFDGNELVEEKIFKITWQPQARIGFIVSNGYGLGHVTRTRAIAKGLLPWSSQSFLSFSAAFTDGAFYVPSAQSLDLQEREGFEYTREACARFFAATDPTHVVYDGNVLPPGMLSALAARPEMHLTWVRRGMWARNTAQPLVAQQALVDLVIEPGDIADAYDNGPDFDTYIPPRAYLKTLSIKPLEDTGPSVPAQNNTVLIMPGASREHDAAVSVMVQQVKNAGKIPVIAHWPMAQAKPPAIDGAKTIEYMPIAAHYSAFDAIISAAGYNSFHELVSGNHKIIFVPQEDPGRDNQLARARWAADQGFAQICRRTELQNLSVLLTRTQPANGNIQWFDDWKSVAEAMGIEGAGISRPLPGKRIRPFSLPRRVKSDAYNQDFVIALGMKTESFFRRGVDTSAIIVTNSIDPVALRRAGYRYVWLNDAYLSRYGAKRQFTRWLEIWKPKAIRVLR